MICFLTSRPDDPDTGALNPANRFTEELRRCFPDSCHAVFVCSDPDATIKTDYYANALYGAFERTGFHFDDFCVLDGRNAERAAQVIKASDIIILAGGHVPTQNRFFRAIALRKLLKDYRGVVIGISAGSMNGADVVYAQPEIEGESIDPLYQRFLTGLNLTKRMLLPHYQDNKDDLLDGRRIYEDIAYPDSIGRAFYLIPDGTYLYIANGKEELRGEAYLLQEGRLTKISEDGGVVLL